MKKIKIKSYCKINLLLKVIKRLKNGYHSISSIITSCNLYDIITISKINSEKGIFDIEKQTLELMGDVLFLHSDGQQIDTNNAVIDLKKAIIYGNKKILEKTKLLIFHQKDLK